MNKDVEKRSVYMSADAIWYDNDLQTDKKEGPVFFLQIYIA